jgi:hypothetical protein
VVDEGRPAEVFEGACGDHGAAVLP